MKNFGNFINIALLSVIILLGCCLSRANAEDVLTITDNPSFETIGQSIWGPGVAVNTKEFNAKLIDIDDYSVKANRWGATQDFTTAVVEGNSQSLCAEGSFIDPFTDDCYSCPDGFLHDPLKMVDEDGVCFKLHSLTTADPAGDMQFLCPGGQFPDASLQNCYSCPSGYDHNPLMSVDEYGVCFSEDTQLKQKKDRWGCSTEEFPDAGFNSCYSCPSGYITNPNQSGNCLKWVNRINTTASRCGTRTRTCVGGYVTDLFTGERTCVLWSLWNYSSCSDYDYRSGNRLYKCGSGYTHDWTKTHGTSGICYKPGHYDYESATYEHSFDCPSGQTAGVDGFCYSSSCPSGYTEILGVCVKSDFAVADQHGATELFCGEGEFLSEGACYTCPSGMEHEPLLPASEAGVCYKLDEFTAEFVGNQFLGCPSGSFLNVVDNLCYTCESDYSWNPLYSVDEAGVCYALQLDENTANGDFELGYEIDSLFRYKHGWKGGITVNTGSVDVAYSPNISVTVSDGPETAEGWQTFVVNTSQLDNSTLDMETNWPEIDMYLDPWTDAVLEANISFTYPKQDPDTLLWSQAQDDLNLWDVSTGGQITFADDPMFSVHVGAADGLDLSVLGLGVEFTGFDPPIEIARPLIKVKGTGLQLGTVIIEGGFQPPAMNTPAVGSGEEHPYNGDYSEQVAFGSGGNGTYIRQSVEAGERTNLNLFALNTGLKDPDVLRADVDLDGLLSWGTGKPMGYKLQHKRPLVGDWWFVTADKSDLDLGVVFTFTADYKFEPNLQVELTFSSPVRVVTASGDILGPVSTYRSSLGEELRFVHPGGELVIDTAYSVMDNTFINDTDLNWTALLAGEVGSFNVYLFRAPSTPKFSMIDYVVDFNELFGAVNFNELLDEIGLNFDIEKPWKVTDLNFLDDTESSVFTLGGFTDQNGSGLQLVVTGVSPVVALCQDITVVLDENGGYSLAPEEIDDGSHDPGSDTAPQFTLSQSEFDCSNIGDNSVTLEVTGATGTFDSCDATVTVEDNISPTIECKDITVNNDAGACGAFVTFNAPAVDDNCSVASTMQTAGMASGSTFPVGTTTNTFKVTDAAGNTASCSFTVTVTDAEEPIITCPADIAVDNDLGVCGAFVTFNAPAVDDNCSVASTIQTTGMASGSTFPVGTTTNTFQVTDASGNSAECSFTVTINDTEPPDAVAKNITVQLDGSGNASIPADGSTVNNGSSDNCAIASTSMSPSSFDCDDVGPNTVTLTVIDVNSNSSTEDAVVTVVDSTCPTVRVELVALELKKKKGCFEISVTAEDNCSVADVVADLNGYLVTDGMIVELKKKKKYKVKVKNEGSSDDDSSGHRRCNADVKFEGPDFILTATVTDSSDNGGGMGSCLDGDGIPTDTASVKHVFINDDHSSDDNGIHRGNDKKNNHKDKGKHKSEGKEKKKKGKK